jgi:tripartite motif-containing protein 71
VDETRIRDEKRVSLGGGGRGALIGAAAVFACILTLGLGFAARRASGDASGDQVAAPLPTAQQTKEALESSATPLEDGPETDAQAAATLPHRNLSRDEALELTDAVFSSELEAPGGIFDELEPTKFLSDTAAVIPVSATPEPAGVDSGAADGLEPQAKILLESSVPLRTENSEGHEEVVDLSLVRDEGELQPQNPLTDVGVPAELGDGISLPGVNATIKIVGAPDERTPSGVEQQYAFYPNIGADTDLVVAPTLQGVEMMTSIRSAAAPRTTEYAIEAPAEAEIVSEDGSAAVKERGRTTIRIPAPTAIDSTGEPVPVEMEVVGDRLRVTISPATDAAYPILVDPTYINETWHWTLQHDSMAAWQGSSTNYPTIEPVPYERWSPSWYPGLDLSSYGTSAKWGDHADWSYWVPRYLQDLNDPKIGTSPSTWILNMYTEGVLFYGYGNTSNYPALVTGLVDPNHGWAVSRVHYGGQGDMNSWTNSFEHFNEHEMTNVKGADMNLVTYEPESQSKLRDTYIAVASISVVDTDAPRFLSLNPPNGWLTGTEASIPFAAEDEGLGVAAVPLAPAGGGVPMGWGTSVSCLGTVVSPCPRVARSGQGGVQPLKFVPNQLPTGEDWLEATAVDPIASTGHRTTGKVLVKVDHTAPDVQLSGPLTEQGVLGTHRPSYALRIQATDGSGVAPQSGIASVEIKVDGKKIAQPEESEWAPNCKSENCRFTGEWALNTSEFTAGSHQVQVIARDAVGLQTVKSIPAELHPPAPTLSVTGSVTEQSILGTARPQYTVKINASALAESPPAANLPTYSSSFGKSGTAGGQFTHPGDIARYDDGIHVGDLFVVDTGGNRIERFTATGTSSGWWGKAGSGPGEFNRPTAIAVASGNSDLLIADSGNKRIQRVGANSGQFRQQIGGPGTGDGQFAGSGPEGVAVDAHGNIWVSDTYGGRLEKFTENGVFVKSVSTRGTGVGQLLEPTGLEAGPGGNIWVTDWGNNKVVEFGPGGAFIREFGREGTGDGEFRHPDGIAIDNKGGVWVGDQGNGRVQEFNQGGEFIGKFGAPGSGAGQLNLGYPIGITTDEQGNVWVTDTWNNRVEKWSSPNYATAGRPTFLRSIGSAGTNPGQFGEVFGVGIDAKGNLWAADGTNNRLQKFSAAGEFLSSYGGVGAGNGQLNYATGLAISSGNIWVAELSNARVQRFSESGAYLSKFGQGGTTKGQLQYPWGIAIDGGHHVWIAETGANDLQEFSETGALIRTVGSKGSGPGQFNGATGIAAGPDGKLWVVDNGNNRVQEFSETGSFIRQFGGSESEVGHLSEPMGIYVDPLEHVWVVDRGHSRVVEFNGAGEYVTQFGSKGTGPAEFGIPQYITGDQSGHLFVSDNVNRRITEWNKPPVYSQISTEIAVDGKGVNTAKASCEAETCATAREWTLESASLAPGIHTVEVKATDGLGNVTKKSVEIQISRDTTKPTLEFGGELADAPEGWIEQETYGFHASATDSDSGVVNLKLIIDNHSVTSETQACMLGGCPAAIAIPVDMSAYSGGAHEAEVVATDQAGNKQSHHWTINIDPEGHISTSEAEATIEAVEETSDAVLAGEPVGEPIEGMTPGLTFQPTDDGGLASEGGEVPMTLGSDPAEGFQLEVLGQAQLGRPCGEEAPKGAGSADEPTAYIEEAEPSAPCVPLNVVEEAQKVQEKEVAEGNKTPGLTPITVTPVGVNPQAESTTLVDNASGIAVNTGESVDTVTRPLTDGGISFSLIRDASASEHYGFELSLGPDMSLRQIDYKSVAVVYEKENVTAFMVSAVPAHDAIGTEVPTSLSKTGPNLVTLTVAHKSGSPGGSDFVYPVSGGTGWQGGYQTISFEMNEPPPPASPTDEEAYELEQLESGEVVVGAMTVGPPEAPEELSNNEKLVLELSPKDTWVKLRRSFEFSFCRPHQGGGDPLAVEGPSAHSGRRVDLAARSLFFHCHAPENDGNYWAVSIYGKYHFVFQKRVWLNWKEWNCDRIWGTEGLHEEPLERLPDLVHCEAFNKGVHYASGDRLKVGDAPVVPLAEYEFERFSGKWGAEAAKNCLVVGGELFANPHNGDPSHAVQGPLVYNRPLHIHGWETCPSIR